MVSEKVCVLYFEYLLIGFLRTNRQMEVFHYYRSKYTQFNQFDQLYQFPINSDERTAPKEIILNLQSVGMK